MPTSDQFVVVPCEHGTGQIDAAQCKKCFGLGRRYVPRGVTPAEFDRLYEPLRVFRSNA